MKKLRIIYALITLGILIAEVLIALYVDDGFVRPYLGDVLVTMLLCSFLRIFFPKNAAALPLFVFLFALVVEIAQYFDYVKLLGFENNRFLSVLMGRSFSVWDIDCYAIGCALFFILDLRLRKIPGTT